jgi:hypothetical protein
MARNAANDQQNLVECNLFYATFTFYFSTPYYDITVAELWHI